MSDLPIVTQVEKVRRARCQYCGGKGDSMKVNLVVSPLGIGYRIPASHEQCRQSVLSLSLSLSLWAPIKRRRIRRTNE